MFNGNVDFTQGAPSGDFPKFSPNPGQVYRIALLHTVNEQQELKPVIRGFKAHWHQVAEGVDGLKSFVCLSTETELAACCKHPQFGEAKLRLAAPILVYPCNAQGEPFPGVPPELQLLPLTAAAFDKLRQVDRSYPLKTNDIYLTAKKLNKGTMSDFLPAGPCLYQQDQASFSHWLGKAQTFTTGTGQAALDRLIGKRVTALDVENALRPVFGGAPGGYNLPPAPPAPIPAPPLPAMSIPAPTPVAVSIPAPAPVSIPAPAPVAPPTGPASPAQMDAISALMAPKV